jgi:hypothetical protein
MKEGGIYRLGKESRFFKDISQLIHFSDEEAYVVNSLIDGLSDDNLMKQMLRGASWPASIIVPT